MTNHGGFPSALWDMVLISANKFGYEGILPGRCFFIRQAPMASLHTKDQTGGAVFYEATRRSSCAPLATAPASARLRRDPELLARRQPARRRRLPPLHRHGAQGQEPQAVQRHGQDGQRQGEPLLVPRHRNGHDLHRDDLRDLRRVLQGRLPLPQQRLAGSCRQRAH